MNYRAVSSIDTNEDFDTFRHKNCFEKGDGGKNLYKHLRHLWSDPSISFVLGYFSESKADLNDNVAEEV
jgi:hypothetical protein